MLSLIKCKLNVKKVISTVFSIWYSQREPNSNCLLLFFAGSCPARDFEFLVGHISHKKWTPEITWKGKQNSLKNRRKRKTRSDYLLCLFCLPFGEIFFIPSLQILNNLTSQKKNLKRSLKIILQKSIKKTIMPQKSSLDK